MIIQEVTQMVSTVGFPICMVIYLVTRFEKTLDRNTKAINNISEIIKRR